MNEPIIEIYDISDSIKDGKKILELGLREFLEELNADSAFRRWDDDIVQYRLKDERK